MILHTDGSIKTSSKLRNLDGVHFSHDMTSMANQVMVLAFGILGNIASLVSFGAPLPTFYKMHKEKSVSEYRAFPYIASLLSQLFWLYYGTILQRDGVFLIVISAIGCVVQTTYLCVYVFYATGALKRRAIGLIVLLDIGLFLVILVGTLCGIRVFLIRQMVVGICCIGASILTFAAPFTIVWQVIQTRTVDFMPFSLSATLTLNATLWLGYGVALSDLFIQIPSGLGMFLGVIQMIIYVYFRYLDGMFVFMSQLPLYQ